MATYETLSGSYVITTQAANQVPIPPAGRAYLFRDSSDLLIYARNSDGTITPISSLAIADDFVNDAAAAGGGVPIGGLYHTTGAVKIRLV